MKFSLSSLLNIRQILRELSTGLTRLDFSSNFRTFEVEVTIAAATETKIRNELTSIPSYVIINGQGNALVTKGDTSWSRNYVYLQNHDASNSSTIKAIFFK